MIHSGTKDIKEILQKQDSIYAHSLCGTLFLDHADKDVYIFAQTGSNKFALLSLLDGDRVRKAVRCVEGRITLATFEKIFGQNSCTCLPRSIIDTLFATAQKYERA